MTPSCDEDRNSQQVALPNELLASGSPSPEEGGILPSA
jgi:hypothetical protein